MNPLLLSVNVDHVATLRNARGGFYPDPCRAAHEAIMAGADSIRDVIAFPKTQTAACPLTEAPTEVSEQQLRDLHIRVRLPPAPG